MLSLALSILYLAVLECLLSADNAIALAAIVHARLANEKDRKHALRYGLLGAYALRVLVILAGVWLMAHPWVKVLAGCYLIYIAARETLFKKDDQTSDPSFGLSTLWKTVVAVELADLMFSVDSIAATLSVSQQFWALVGGALIGIAAMRFAAGYVIKLMDRWPWLTYVAMTLVAFTGFKVLFEAAGL